MNLLYKFTCNNITCSKEFEVTKSYATRYEKTGRTPYCCRKCSHEGHTYERVSCTYCKNIVTHLSKTKSERVFCNHSCAAKYLNKFNIRVEKFCISCANKLTTKNHLLYCSKECRQKYPRILYITEWKKGNRTGAYKDGELSLFVREYIWEKHRSKCAKCGWDTPHIISGKPPLQIDHIDGNADNNKEENLILLCPNCHALTETFGGYNRGYGRELRRLKRKTAPVA